MKQIIGILTLILASLAVFAQTGRTTQDSTKRTPFVKELPRDTAKYKMPIQKADTMKSNMPVVAPDKTKVQPK